MEHHGRLRRLHLPRQQPVHRARRVHDRHPGRPGAPLAVRRLPGQRPGLRAGRRGPEPGHPAYPRHVLRHRHVRRAATARHRRDHLVRADRWQPGPGPAAAHVEPVLPELAVLLPAARPAGPDRRGVRRGPAEQARPRPVRDRGRRGQGGRARPADRHLQDDRVRVRRDVRRHRGRPVRLLHLVPERGRRVRHRHQRADRAGRPAGRARHPVGPGAGRLHPRAAGQLHQHRPGGRRRRGHPAAAVRWPARRGGAVPAPGRAAHRDPAWSRARARRRCHARHRPRRRRRPGGRPPHRPALVPARRS